VKTCTDCGKIIEGIFKTRCSKCNERYKDKKRRQREKRRESIYMRRKIRTKLDNMFPYYCEYCKKRFREYDECESHEFRCPQNRKRNY
jgi:hypothetical protein